MELAVIAVASCRQGSEEEAAVRRDRNGLKGAGVIRQASVMANAMRRGRFIDPLDRGAGRHDGHLWLIVGCGRFERDLDRIWRDNSSRCDDGEEHDRGGQKKRTHESGLEKTGSAHDIPSFGTDRT